MLNTEQEVDAALAAISGGSVLDVATGMGSMINWAIQAFKDYREIIGIDQVPISERPANPDLSVFEREDVRFEVMNAHHLTFADASFDTVMISHSLHHLLDARQVLAEMMRVLKPGGHLIVNEMYRDGQTEEQLTHVYMHHWWASIDRALGVSHNETYTRQQLIDWSEDLALRRRDCFDYADLNTDPHDPAALDQLRGSVQRYLDRAKDLPDFAAIQGQADELTQRLETIGMRWATVLLIIGQK